MNGLLEGLPITRHYCVDCFDLGKLPPEVEQAARAFNDQQRKTAFDAQARQMGAMGSKLDELCARERWFPREAYEFVFQAMAYALKKDSVPGRWCGRHVTAGQLVEACGACAKEKWGESARDRLKSWGIETSADFGDAVFLLVENGFMGKRDEDSRVDFQGLPFLE